MATKVYVSDFESITIITVSSLRSIFMPTETIFNLQTKPTKYHDQLLLTITGHMALVAGSFSRSEGDN